MRTTTATLDQNERKQFLEAFEENIELLLELLEAVRSESENIDDTMAAEFMTGLSQLVRVFRRSHRLQDHTAFGHSGMVTRSRGTSDSGVVSEFTAHESD